MRVIILKVLLVFVASIAGILFMGEEFSKLLARTFGRTFNLFDEIYDNISEEV
mgnify:CR=1 FL=1